MGIMALGFHEKLNEAFNFVTFYLVKVCGIRELKLSLFEILNSADSCLKWSRCGLGHYERVCQASRVESLDGNRQALEQESCFSRISRRIRQAPSDLRQEFPGTDTQGAKRFQGHWKKIVGCLFIISI